MGPNWSLWVFVGLYASLCVIVGPNVFLWVLWILTDVYGFLCVLRVARKGAGGEPPPLEIKMSRILFV